MREKFCTWLAVKYFYLLPPIVAGVLIPKLEAVERDSLLYSV